MAKSERLFQLLQVLRCHRQAVTGETLAREMGVSLRTLYRDVAALQAMGADIEGESGVGYVLRPGFLLPPLMLSHDEIQALALGAQWVSKQTDHAMAFAAANAISKIVAVLPADLRLIVDDNAFHVGKGTAVADVFNLPAIRQAMRNQHKISLTYRDENSRHTERTIWPIAVGFIDAHRYVAGWCEKRADFRVFRADRIQAMVFSEDRYPGRRRELVARWRANATDRI